MLDNFSAQVYHSVTSAALSGAPPYTRSRSAAFAVAPRVAAGPRSAGTATVVATAPTGPGFTVDKGVSLSADVLIHAYNNKKGAGLLALFNEAAGKAGLDFSGVQKIDEIPYDFLRRRLTIVVAEDGSPTQHLIVTKGAFANVLATFGEGGVFGEMTTTGDRPCAAT